MRPIFVDLDLENSIFLDGSMSAAAFEYRTVTEEEDLFERCDKISYVYGNRKIRRDGYLKVVGLLARYVD